MIERGHVAILFREFVRFNQRPVQIFLMRFIESVLLSFRRCQSRSNILSQSGWQTTAKCYQAANRLARSSSRHSASHGIHRRFKPF